jgi:hypothetical protein
MANPRQCQWNGAHPRLDLSSRGQICRAVDIPHRTRGGGAADIGLIINIVSDPNPSATRPFQIVSFLLEYLDRASPLQTRTAMDWSGGGLLQRGCSVHLTHSSYKTMTNAYVVGGFRKLARWTGLAAAGKGGILLQVHAMSVAGATLTKAVHSVRYKAHCQVCQVYRNYLCCRSCVWRMKSGTMFAGHSRLMLINPGCTL